MNQRRSTAWGFRAAHTHGQAAEQASTRGGAYVKMTFSPGRPSERSTTAYKQSVSHAPGREERHRRRRGATHVFATDLPPLLLLVEALRELVAVRPEADDDVALDRAHAADPGRACGGRHRADRDLEVGRWRRSAVVRQLGRGGSVLDRRVVISRGAHLAMVQVALEDDEVRAREVEEQIGRFVVELPEGEARAPERVLLIHPLARLFVLLELCN